MKKQLTLALSVTLASFWATADVTITGDARFRYNNKSLDLEADGDDTTPDNYTSNTNDHRARIFFTGTSGDTTVFADLRHNNGSSGVGNFYFDTSIGPVDVRGGKFYNTIGLGKRKVVLNNNRVLLSSTFGDWTVGLNMQAGGEPGIGDLFVKGNVGGATLQLAHNPNNGIANPTADSGNGSWTDIAISGNAGNFSYGLEYFIDGSDYDNDMLYAELGMELDTVDLKFAMIENDARDGYHRTLSDSALTIGGNSVENAVIGVTAIDGASLSDATYQGGVGESAFLGSPLIDGSNTALVEVDDLESMLGISASMDLGGNTLTARFMTGDIFPEGLGVTAAGDGLSYAYLPGSSDSRVDILAAIDGASEIDTATIFENFDASTDIIDLTLSRKLAAGADLSVIYGQADVNGEGVTVFGTNLFVRF